MHSIPCTHIFKSLQKSRRIWPLFCIDSTLKKKTFYGTNKNKAQSLGSEADKCQMCTTKGALVLKADQLQKMNWLCFSDPPTSPQNTWCGLQLCHPISEHVFLSFVLTKKCLLHQEKQEFICFMWVKSKGNYMQVWLFYRYMHLCHWIKRSFVNSLVFLCWHFLCRQRSSFVRVPGTCTQLCSVMESQACVSWSLETGKEKGDLSKDESVGDREHCIFCGAVLRGRGRWEWCLHSKPPPPLPKPVSEKGRKRQTCWSTTKPCSRKMKALGGNITPMHLWNTSPREEEWGKSHHCCYGNQILPITGRRCAKVLGSLAAAHIISQTPPFPTSLFSPKTLMVSRLCVQKWRVMELQQCSTNHPGKIYSGLSLRNARGFLVIICHCRNVLGFFAPPLNQIEGRIKRGLEASPMIHVCLLGFLHSWGWMRDTSWRINFGVGLLGVSNLAEENMLPTCVIFAASMSEEMRAGFYQWRQGGMRTKEKKAKEKLW